MFAPFSDTPAWVSRDHHQTAFLAALPRIEAHARATFSFLRCPHQRDDAVAEVVACAWERVRRRQGPVTDADRLAAWAVHSVRVSLARALAGSQPGLA